MQPTTEQLASLNQMGQRTAEFWRAAYRANGDVLPGLMMVRDPIALDAVVLNPESIGPVMEDPRALRAFVQQQAPMLGTPWAVVWGKLRVYDVAMMYNGKPNVYGHKDYLLVVIDGPGISCRWAVQLFDDGSVGEVESAQMTASDGPFAGISGSGPLNGPREVA